MFSRLKIIDRFIIGKFVRTFLFTSLLFSLIAIIIDISQKIKDFLVEDITWKEILFDYYLNFVPNINMLLWPLFIMISVIFFTSRMSKESETIAIFQAGLSLPRFLRPYLITAGCICFIHLIFNHYILPIGNKKKVAFENKIYKRNLDQKKLLDIHMFMDPKTKVYLKNFRVEDSTAFEFRIETFGDKSKMVSLLKAASATYLPSKNLWKLQQYTIRRIDGLNEYFYSSSTPKDTFIDIKPNDFVRYRNVNESLTSYELQELIQEEKRRGIGNGRNYEIEFHRRTADSFTIIILTIIGMIVASRKVRGGMGLPIAIGVGAGALFILLSKFSLTLATVPGIPTYLGVWIPNLLFMGFAYYLYKNAQS